MLKPQAMPLRAPFVSAGLLLLLAAAVVNIAACRQPSFLPSRAMAAVQSVAQAALPPRRFYCGAGAGGQYSGVHRGWVCPTSPG